MTYQMKPLRCDPANLQGLSERLVVSHYENNYGGAVKNGAKAAAYVDAFMQNINWRNAANQYQRAVSMRGS